MGSRSKEGKVDACIGVHFDQRVPRTGFENQHRPDVRLGVLFDEREKKVPEVFAEPLVDELFDFEKVHAV